MQHSQNPS